jgi:hypothetical protein
MADLTAKTLAEMQAGANALAAKASREALPPEYLEGMRAIHSRNLTLRNWEAAGKLRIETTKRWSVKYEDRAARNWHTLYHVVLSSGQTGPTFNDIPAERAGASPSELLIANIALALQAHGEL